MVFDLLAPLDVLVDRLAVKITRLTVPIEITDEVTTHRCLVARRYSEGRRILGWEGEFEYDDAGVVLKRRVQVIPRSDNKNRIIVYAPENLPEDRKNDLYVWSLSKRTRGGLAASSQSRGLSGSRLGQ
jgi:hypothetical protein